MKHVILAAAAAGVLAVTATTAAATDTAAPERTGTVEAGKTYTWQGAAEVNANPFYFAQVPQQPDVAPVEQGTCSASPHQACDEILVKFVNPLTQLDLQNGKTEKRRVATVDVGDFAPVAQATDFDLQVFASDANGANKGFFTGEQASSQSGELIGTAETLDVPVTTTAAQPETYMLIRVIRYLSVNATYKGTVTF